MSYTIEGKRLIEEARIKTEALMEKYKEYQNPGMLDGEPWDAELREINKEFSAALKALREKYPNWKDELENHQK